MDISILRESPKDVELRWMFRDLSRCYHHRTNEEGRESMKPFSIILLAGFTLFPVAGEALRPSLPDRTPVQQGTNCDVTCFYESVLDKVFPRPVFSTKDQIRLIVFRVKPSFRPNGRS
jgi:hypothetical protein